MNAGAIIVSRQRRAVGRLAEAGATVAERARRLEDLGVRRSFAVRALLARSVLSETEDGRVWVDLGAWEELQRRRRRVLRWSLGVALVALALLLGSRAGLL